MTGEPARSLEIERKYDVDPDTAVPDLSALPGVTAVGEPELRELDAVYFDTDDRALARAGVAVRRRTGGPDEGWHIKISTPEGKHELHWPLTAESDVPDAVAAELAVWTRGPLLPLARIRNRRTAYALTNADGGLVAEAVDDRVEGTALRRGTHSRWRELEVELGPAAPAGEPERAAFFAAVEAAVRLVGGAPSASGSKLARVLTA